MKFQCSSASRKFLNLPDGRAAYSGLYVSVLFSEPKIPQPYSKNTAYTELTRFQCSSASRKFLNRGWRAARHARLGVSVLFSEPKIPQPFKMSVIDGALKTFQCSSASRKFLNHPQQRRHRRRPRFSALQRAENSSTARLISLFA